jgi:hypothetical protein
MFFSRRFLTCFSTAPLWFGLAISPLPGLNAFFIPRTSQLSRRWGLGRFSLLGLPLSRSRARSFSAGEPVAVFVKLSFVIARPVCLISGVASLSIGSGDLGVSPADESSKSGFVLRGVLYRLLNAAIDDLLGLLCGESNAL